MRFATFLSYMRRIEEPLRTVNSDVYWGEYPMTEQQAINFVNFRGSLTKKGM